MTLRRSALLLASSALLSACATLPIGNRDEKMPIFATAPEAPETWAASGVAGQAPQGDWAASFQDPQLSALISEALTRNPTLKSREALVRSAEAFTRVARAAGRPSVSASLSGGVTSTGVTIGGVTDRVESETFGAGLDASWEADFWGRIRAGVLEAEADFRASQADLAAAELSVSAQTAIAWVRLNEAIALERVANDTFAARDRARVLTERRVQSGLASPLDVRTARTALAGSESVIALREQLSGDAARRLEVLIGRYPAAALEATGTLPTLAPIVVEGSPTVLLARRPDIAAAEARVAAAGLRAEQARLAMLPAFRLTAALDGSGKDLADVFDPDLIAGRLIASVLQPIYSGGRLNAQRDAAVAQAEASVANYAASVLSAWSEVESAIAADAFIARQEEAIIRALNEARLAEELAERQYSSGTITVFNLISAQTQRLNAESDLVAIRADRAVNRISYHLALGGAAIAPAKPE